MKKSKHPGRLPKVAKANAGAEKAVKAQVAATNRWLSDTKSRIKEIEALSKAFQAKQKEVNAYIKAYVDLVTQITDLEYEWENESDPKKKKKLEAEHKNADKSADGMIAELNGRFAQALVSLTDDMTKRSEIMAIKV